MGRGSIWLYGISRHTGAFGFHVNTGAFGFCVNRKPPNLHHNLSFNTGCVNRESTCGSFSCGSIGECNYVF